ncbi:conserved Plasmodium protein, unknown function [Plasmodium chabaudi chabaudi]|uniref:Uncharacterized protein n=1 Tax=Plasmodium chabaudi chabaudi TaxID=31271 RepID=A0A1C6XIY4_PLACU|nr:conserved Plasmodium protein, unknown function [Plasmodium chabaudi chabaudi]
MDNLFTINIDPDENVCLNDDKNKDEIPRRAKYKNDQIDYIDADSFDLIPYEINEIRKTDDLETISELNDNQITQYQNIRKNIQKYIFKCFKEDDVVIDFPDISKDTFIEQLHFKNVKITLNKDKVDEIIAHSSREKHKRNKPSELNNRYYCDKNIFDEDETSDKNFIDMLIGNDISIDKINVDKENEANKDASSQNVQYNEENDQNENDKITQYNDNSTIQTINSANDCNNGKNEILENEENDEKCDDINNTNNTIYENTLEPFKFNNIISEFGKKINNWLIKFPDIDCENFFFHLFFLSEHHREKGFTCNNCGSHNMENCSNSNYKCENNYCFICDKHKPGHVCHNTRAQYNYFKHNLLKSLYYTTDLKYPNNIIPCLKCMSNDHYICGNPPYIFSQESYMFRKEFSRQFDYKNYVYFKNSHYIWEINDSFKNMVKKNNNFMIRPPPPDDDNSNWKNQNYTKKNSIKRNHSSDDYNNKNNIARYIDANEDFANETGEMYNGIYKNKNKKRFKNNRNINIPRLKYDSEEHNESEIDNDEYDTEYNKHIPNDSTQLYKGKRGSDHYHHENYNNFNSNNKRRKRSYNDNNNSDNNWNNENNNNVNGHKNTHRNLYNNNKHGNKMKHSTYDKNNQNTNYNYNKNFNYDNKKYDNNKKEQNSGYNNHYDSDIANNNEPLLGFDTLENYMGRNKKSHSFLNTNYTKTNKNNFSNFFSKNVKKNEYGGSSKHGFANNNKNNVYKGLYKNGKLNWDQHNK